MRGGGAEDALRAPLCDRQAAGKLAGRLLSHCLGYPAIITVIDEPGGGAHAVVVHANTGIRKAPVLLEAQGQPWLGDHS